MLFRPLAIPLLLACGLANAQKQIDIGAENAPLSGQDRVELAAAVARHDYAAERTVIDRASKVHPMSAELMIMDGRLSYLEKHAKEAADALSRADKVKPLADTDRMTLALAYQFSGRPTQARSELVRLTKSNPTNPDYFYLLGRIDHGNKRLEDAVASLRKATELNTGLMRAYEELGQCEEALGLTDDAKKTYALAAQRNREQPAKWEWSPVDYGAFLLKQGDLDEAEKLFRESLRYNPRFGWAHYYLGQTMQRRNKDDEATAEYLAAVTRDSAIKPAWLALGREYTRAGKTELADRALAIFRQLDEKDRAVRTPKN